MIPNYKAYKDASIDQKDKFLRSKIIDPYRYSTPQREILAANLQIPECNLNAVIDHLSFYQDHCLLIHTLQHMIGRLGCEIISVPSEKNYATTLIDRPYFSTTYHSDSIINGLSECCAKYFFAMQNPVDHFAREDENAAITRKYCGPTYTLHFANQL
jgi:hypothetical protein